MGLVNAVTTVRTRLLKTYTPADNDTGVPGGYPAAVTVTIPESNRYSKFWIQVEGANAGTTKILAKVSPLAAAFAAIPSTDHTYGGDVAAAGATYFLPDTSMPGGVQLDFGTIAGADVTVYLLMAGSVHSTTHPGK